MEFKAWGYGKEGIDGKGRGCIFLNSKKKKG
jgi:hypothetical protein